MVKTLNGLGSTVTIRARGTTVSAGFNTNVAVVGGYDASNRSATAGEITTLQNPNTADTSFGANSELNTAIGAMSANGGGTIYAVPPAETTGNTESFTSSSSGTLSNVPFDPRVHPEHEITATDTVEASDVTVNYVDNPSPSSPSDTNTINLNPVNKEWSADESSDYDITYDYGDYTSAIQTAVDLPVRYVVVLSEADEHTNTLQSELQTFAKNFDFKRGITGARPSIGTGSISSYSPNTDDWRLIEVAPSRATRNGQDVRTAAAVAGLLAKQPINVEGSITYDSVAGLDDLKTNYLPTEAKDFDYVTALTREFEVAEGVTTSTEDAFSDIYAAEIIDTTADALFQFIKNFKGGGNTEDDQAGLRSDIKLTLSSFETERPPLLSGSSVRVDTGDVDTETDVTVGIDPAPIAKQVNLDIAVGDVITFEGAST